MIDTELIGGKALTKAAADIPSAVGRAADASLKSFASSEVSRLRSAAAGASRVARLAARGVKSTGAVGGARISAGGSGQATTGATFGDLFFGSEFGGGGRPSTRQFEPYRAEGYWFFPTIQDDEDELDDVGRAALAAAGKVWG